MEAGKQVYHEIITTLFVFFFSYNVLTQLKDFKKFSLAMEHSPLIRSYSAGLAVLIPIFEVAAVLLLVVPVTRKIGLWCTVFIMGISTAYTAWVMFNGRELPCVCAGLFPKLAWKEQLLANTTGFILAVFSGINYKKIIAINRSSRTPAI